MDQFFPSQVWQWEPRSLWILDKWGVDNDSRPSSVRVRVLYSKVQLQKVELVLVSPRASPRVKWEYCHVTTPPTGFIDPQGLSSFSHKRKEPTDILDIDDIRGAVQRFKAKWGHWTCMWSCISKQHRTLSVLEDLQFSGSFDMFFEVTRQRFDRPSYLGRKGTSFEGAPGSGQPSPTLSVRAP